MEGRWNSNGDAARAGSPYMVSQQHGKSRVRVARTWRVGSVHQFAEWDLEVLLESDVDPAYITGDNSCVVATDTCKNTCYYIAKSFAQPCTVEDFALRLASHFVTEYKHVHKVRVKAVQKSWNRVSIGGKPHKHGFQAGRDSSLAFVTQAKGSSPTIVSGVTDWQVLKTTQSGFVNYHKDRLSTLPEVDDRILATSVTAEWTYSSRPTDFAELRSRVYAAIAENFFGPADTGVYSPSVQYTLREISKLVFERCPEIDSICLKCPNIHFIPMPRLPADLKINFEDDVYIATSEPHGNIQASFSRTQRLPTTHPFARL